MSTKLPPKSYFDLAPLESGGVIARSGFIFQDHVAAKYCIHMLQDDELIEVWCETLDDITLVRNNGGQYEFEFVQAKSNEFDHFWSVAELCKRDKKTVNPELKTKVQKKTEVGKSILEKLLDNERGIEPCKFRLVTSLPVNDDLKVLTLALSSPIRTPQNEDISKLCHLITEKISDFKSPKGSDISSWLLRTVWEICYSTQALQNANLLALRKIGSDLGYFLAEDQWDELYKKILQKVQDAGSSKWEVDPEAKRLKKNDFLIWIKKMLYNAQHPGVAGKGEQLSEKMKLAEIPDDTIENAQLQRRFYRSRTINPSYLDLSRREEIEMNTQAHLHSLVSRLDSGQLDVSGIEFHTICLNLIQELQNDMGDISLAFLQGFMYSLADRCVHRFTKVAI